MTDMTPIADEAATRLAFSLMRSAYLDLARTLRSIEREAACELLRAVEHRIAYRLGSVGENPADATPQADALTVAAGRVRAVLREAQDG
jgi:hypothetical protein